MIKRLILVGALLLLVANFILLVCHHGVWQYGARPYDAVAALFNLDGEQNVPAWFATALWLMLALSCFAAYLSEKIAGKHSKTRWYWLLLGCGGIFLSLDEAVELHEKLGTIGQEALTGTAAGNFLDSHVPDSPWLMFYLPPLLVVAVLTMVFLYNRLAQHRILWITLWVSAFCFAAAIGHELFQAMPMDHFKQVVHAMGLDVDTAVQLSIMLEETLENMASGLLALTFAGYSLLIYQQKRSLQATGSRAGND